MGYYDDADADLLMKPWYFPPDGQQFSGRKAGNDSHGDPILGAYIPWWDTNTMNWRDLIHGRDWAWQMNQGLLANYRGVAGDWFRNNNDRPGMAGPFPEPPAAYIALCTWMDKINSDGTTEVDGSGNPYRTFKEFAVVKGGSPICPTPAH